MTPPTPLTKKHWRSRYPLESFDPRFALLLKKAALMTAEKPLTIPFLTSSEAVVFQNRIYQFRGKAREAGHEDGKLYQRVRITRKANILVLYAQDSQFDDAFAIAGVGEDPERPAALEPEDTTNIMDDPALADFFKENK